MTYDQWITLGIANGWCSVPICYTHDSIPFESDEEADSYFDDLEPCIPTVRLYPTQDHTP